MTFPRRDESPVRPPGVAVRDDPDRRPTPSRNRWNTWSLLMPLDWPDRFRGVMTAGLLPEFCEPRFPNRDRPFTLLLPSWLRRVDRVRLEPLEGLPLGDWPRNRGVLALPATPEPDCERRGVMLVPGFEFVLGCGMRFDRVVVEPRFRRRALPMDRRDCVEELARGGLVEELDRGKLKERLLPEDLPELPNDLGCTLRVDGAKERGVVEGRDRNDREEEPEPSDREELDPRERLPNDRLPEDRPLNDRLPDERPPNDRMPEDRPLNDRLPDERPPKDREPPENERPPPKDRPEPPPLPTDPRRPCPNASVPHIPGELKTIKAPTTVMAMAKRRRP